MFDIIWFKFWEQKSFPCLYFNHNMMAHGTCEIPILWSNLAIFFYLGPSLLLVKILLVTYYAIIFQLPPNPQKNLYKLCYYRCLSGSQFLRPTWFHLSKEFIWCYWLLYWLPGEIHGTCTSPSPWKGSKVLLFVCRQWEVVELFSLLHM